MLAKQINIKRRPHAWILRLRLCTLFFLPGLQAQSQAKEPDILSFSFSNSSRVLNESLRDPTQPFYLKIQTGNPTPGVLEATVDKNTKYSIGLSDKTPFNDTMKKSIVISLLPQNDDYNAKDKLYLNVVEHWGKKHVDISETAITEVTFWFMLGAGYENPSYDWLAHMQVWQCCGGHPPMAMGVVPSNHKLGPVTFYWDASDDKHELHHQRIELARASVDRERWYFARLRLQPRVSRTEALAHLAFWLDGRTIFEYNGSWGYAAERFSTIANARLTNNMGIDLGVYRRRQDTRQTILYYDIKVTRFP